MTPSQKRRAELDSGILKRKNIILNSAITEFCRQGIENTTMTDVAKAAQVGVATVYRYFTSKDELVIQCAVLFWKNEETLFVPTLLTPQYREMSGIRQVQVSLNVFPLAYEKSREFLIFLYEFDSYVRSKGISMERLTDYGSELIHLKTFVTDALKKGLDDGTVRIRNTVEETYCALTHLLLSFCEKLAIHGDILNIDNRVEPETQIKDTVELLVDALRAQPDNRHS